MLLADDAEETLFAMVQPELAELQQQMGMLGAMGPMMVAGVMDEVNAPEDANAAMAAIFVRLAGVDVASEENARRAIRVVIQAAKDLDIEDGAARIVACPSGKRVAVFRSGDSFTAISNICAHQGGPLGEGRVIDGCATCPWHGYQYDPETGASPAPFTERVPTFDVRVVDGRVLVANRPNPAGTRVEPARIGGDA